MTLHELLIGQRTYAAASLLVLRFSNRHRLVSKKPDERYRRAAEALEALMGYPVSEVKFPHWAAQGCKDIALRFP